MKQWEATINRLIKESALRKASDRSGMSRIAMVSTASSSTYRSTNQSSHPSPASAYSHTSQSSTSNTIRGRPSGNLTPCEGPYSSGPQGYPPHDGFDVDNDDEDSEDYSSSGQFGPVSGHTPVFRRGPNSLSMPPERESNNPATDRPRAQTEGTDGPVIAQWRSNGLLPPMPNSSSIQSPQGMRPGTPRLNSNVSANSYATDASFGSAIPPPPKSARPQLRSQYSSTRLRNGYESPNNSAGGSAAAVAAPSILNAGDYRGGRSATPTLLPPQPLRSRSLSQPQAYVPPSSSKGSGAPPLPANSTVQSHWNRDREFRPLPTTSNGVPLGEVKAKRGSGSSQSTGESSDYSPNSSSPITPYGSSESSLGGIVNSTLRMHSTMVAVDRHRHQYQNHLHHHNHNYNNNNNNHHPEAPSSPPVKVKVHFHEDIFVIQVPKLTEYGDLVDKVGKKIRLCGPRREDGPLRVKYKDEDGDIVSVGSTEDVQMAFEQYRPGGQVTLFVT